MIGISETIILDKEYEIVIVPLSPLFSYTAKDARLQTLQEKAVAEDELGKLTTIESLQMTDNLFRESEKVSAFKLRKIIVQGFEVIKKIEEMGLCGVVLQALMIRLEEEKKTP